MDFCIHNTLLYFVLDIVIGKRKMKVKILQTNHEFGLEEKINYFIKYNPELKIIDVKFSTLIADGFYNFYAMIIYKDSE